MPRILNCRFTAALLLLSLLCASPAVASTPPAASVRIEGTGATLQAQTSVQTTTATTVKGSRCPGSSAAGALDVATAGNWSGSYSASFKDFLVGTILGETPTGSNFWNLWINGRSSSTGACSTTLHPGDHELWFDCQSGPPPSFACTNDPLALKAPAAVRAGHRATVSVVQLDGAGHGAPFSGAAVTGSGVAAVTGSGGEASILPRKAGIVALQAAKSGATPSDPVFVCVYSRRRSQCGQLHGPPVHVTGISEHELFRHAPRELRGTAGPDASGLTDVSLSLRRRAPGGRCSFYDSSRGAFRVTRCHPGKPTPSFSVGAGASWSYLLPAALAPGNYRLDVVATGGNGRRTKLVTGVSSLDFSVVAAAPAAAGEARAAFTAAEAARAAPTAAAARAAPSVQMMVVGRTQTLLSSRLVKLRAAKIAIGHRRCSVPVGTALAGLLAAHLRLRVTDSAGCDPSSMFVRRVGRQANRGFAGWEYKVGQSAPSFAASDPGGRLRSGRQLLWFWCTSAGGCQRTLVVTWSGSGASRLFTVRGYDDNGHSTVIPGATVQVGQLTGLTGASGSVAIAVAPGHHQVSATKQGLVPSFPAKLVAAL